METVGLHTRTTSRLYNLNYAYAASAYLPRTIQIIAEFLLSSARALRKIYISLSPVG